MEQRGPSILSCSLFRYTLANMTKVEQRDYLRRRLVAASGAWTNVRGICSGTMFCAGMGWFACTTPHPAENRPSTTDDATSMPEDDDDDDDATSNGQSSASNSDDVTPDDPNDSNTGDDDSTAGDDDD